MTDTRVFRRDPFTGAQVGPLGYLGGEPVWPFFGAEDDDDDDDSDDDDTDDDTDDDDTDDDDDDDEPDDEKGKKKKKSGGDDTDDEESVSIEEYNRLKAKRRESEKHKTAAERENRRLKKQLAAATGKKPPKDEPGSAVEPDFDADDFREVTEERDTLRKRLGVMARTNAFLMASTAAGIRWVNDRQALRAGPFDELEVDEETGEVDGMARAVKVFAKKNPHLVIAKPKKKVDSDDSDDDTDDEETTPRRKSGASVGKPKSKKGTGKKKLTKTTLRSRFPALS